MMSISILSYLIVLHTILGSGFSQSLSNERQLYVQRSRPTPTGFSEPPSDGWVGEDSIPPHGLLNAEMFDSLVTHIMTSRGANVSDQIAQCAYRRYLEPLFLNFTTETGDQYCPSYYDEIQCWKASTPGNVTLPCPSSFNGIKYDSNTRVLRHCLKNGQWGNGNLSDYSNCKAIVNFENEEELLHLFQLSVIGNVGYSISLCTTLGALLILVTCKSLWCLRNYIHVNFLISFIIIYLVFFSYLLAQHNGLIDLDGRNICPFSVIILAATGANFGWMLVEGIYLYCTIVRRMTVAPKMLWLYAVVGWVVPVGLAIIDITIRLTTMDVFTSYNEACIEHNFADYIIRIPLMIIILINVYFMIHIIVAIVRGQRSLTTGDVQQSKKAVRALVVLTPLLGVAYLLFLIEPTPDEATVATHIYRYTLALLQSTQGFFVALFYVFLNPEVHRLLKRRFARLRVDNTLFTNAASQNESKPSILKDVDEINTKFPTEGDNNIHKNPPPRNGEVPNPSQGSCEHGEEPGETTPMGSEALDDDVNANNFHLDQRCPDTDIESAPFVRHAGYDEEKRMEAEGEKSQFSVKT